MGHTYPFVKLNGSRKYTPRLGDFGKLQNGSKLRGHRIGILNFYIPAIVTRNKIIDATRYIALTSVWICVWLNGERIIKKLITTPASLSSGGIGVPRDSGSYRC